MAGIVRDSLIDYRIRLAICNHEQSEQAIEIRIAESVPLKACERMLGWELSKAIYALVEDD